VANGTAEFLGKSVDREALNSAALAARSADRPQSAIPMTASGSDESRKSEYDDIDKEDGGWV
jgi:hypothetical protein